MTRMGAKRLRSDRDHRRGARLGVLAASLGRVAVGAALVARPEALPRAVGVDSVSARRMGWVVRLFAVRDAVLGAGAVHALVRGRPVAGWLVAQSVSDGADAVALALAVRGRSVSAVRAAPVIAFAVGGCAGTIAAARNITGDSV
jgi:hypothetical protein